jgi:hypothetical protein
VKEDVAIGTPYVPRDMIAMIHQGERIIPAAENRAGGRGGDTYAITVQIPPGAAGSEMRRAAGSLGREVASAVGRARRFT